VHAIKGFALLIQIVHLRRGRTIFFYKDIVKWMQLVVHYNPLRGRMKHRIAFLLTGLILASCIPSPEVPILTPEDKLAEIQARGTLVIATDADYMPQSRLLQDVLPLSDTKCEPLQYTANQMTGFDVAVAVELARRLQVEPCFVTPPWSQLIAGNWGDNWDIHVGSVGITEERMQNLYFSQPYFATPIVILFHQNNSSFQSAEDLSGKRIGVCAGCIFESYLRSTLRLPGQTLKFRIQYPRIIAYQNEDPAIEDLSLGDGTELDAVITILPKALEAIEGGKPIRVLDEPLLFTHAAITLDRSSQRDPARLLAQITGLIQDMHREGTLKELSIRYQSLDLTQEAARFDLASLESAP
jgi:polar amino acid transport system substrate-binding protein